MKQKKQYGVSSELVHLDVKEILNNYTNPEYWKKRWLIFKSKDIEANFRLNYINVTANTITCAVIVRYLGKARIYWEKEQEAYCDSIPIDNPDYKQELFERNVLSNMFRAITRIEEAILKQTYEYAEAVRLEHEEIKKLEDIAKEFLDGLKITNEDVRTAYIEKYVSNTRKYDYTGQLVKTAERRYFPTVRLFAASWFGNKKIFEAEHTHLDMEKKPVKKLIYNIWRNRRKLNSEEYLEEAKEALEAL